MKAVARAEVTEVALRLLTVGGVLMQAVMSFREIEKRTCGKKMVSYMIVDVERRDEEAFKICAFYVKCLKDYFYGATVRMFRNPT